LEIDILNSLFRSIDFLFISCFGRTNLPGLPRRSSLVVFTINRISCSSDSRHNKIFSEDTIRAFYFMMQVSRTTKFDIVATKVCGTSLFSFLSFPFIICSYIISTRYAHLGKDCVTPGGRRVTKKEKVNIRKNVFLICRYRILTCGQFFHAAYSANFP